MESLQVYKDVQADIKESNLSKEEKFIEEDRALDARMPARLAKKFKEKYQDQ